MEKKLKLYFTNEKSRPIVFHNRISQWPALHWTPQNLENFIGCETLTFRIGLRDSDEIQWETKCHYVCASVTQFNEWTYGNFSSENPLSAYPKHAYWCYADYKHMVDISAPRKEEFMSSVDWSMFGFEGRNSRDSTFWLGSSEAYTVCHYDTYGYNLVAQVYGSKRWRLFPPHQTSCLYPTRIPYEESSVFSAVNILQPDFVTHSKYNEAQYCDVILKPGDVLFVPHLWWHFVENLETSISINTWVEMETIDDTRRLEEAVTRALVCSLMSENVSINNSNWVNPTEKATDFKCNINYIQKSLSSVCSTSKPLRKRAASSDEVGDKCLSEKRHRSDVLLIKTNHKGGIFQADGKTKVDDQDADICGECKNYKLRNCICSDCDSRTIVSPEFDNNFIQRLPLRVLKPDDANNLIDKLVGCERSETVRVSGADMCEESNRVASRTFIDAVLHPEVISRICDILLRQ